MDGIIIVILVFALMIWLTHPISISKRMNDKKSKAKARKSEKGTYRYHNHCWLCHNVIDSQKNKRCPNCGWYICSNCGSCKKGCNRDKEESEIEEAQSKALSDNRMLDKITELEVGNTIIHKTFGRMEVTRIEKGIIYLITTNGVEKKFVLDDTLRKYIDDIL